MQQPCPPPNGTFVLADNQLLPENHILNPSDIYGSTLTGLITMSVVLFILTIFIFVINFRKILLKKKQNVKQKY